MINTQSSVVDLFDMAKGVYFVQVDIENGVFTENIIKA